MSSSKIDLCDPVAKKIKMDLCDQALDDVASAPILPPPPRGPLPGESETDEDDEEWNEEDALRYHDQVAKSGGFDVERGTVPRGAMSLIGPMDINKKNDFIDFKSAAELAIKAYNHEFPDRKGGELQFVKVLKCMRQFSAIFIYYLTFDARDLSNGKDATYQAVIEQGIQFEFEVLSFRLKPSGVGPKKWFWRRHLSLIRECEENEASEEFAPK